MTQKVAQLLDSFGPGSYHSYRPFDRKLGLSNPNNGQHTEFQDATQQTGTVNKILKVQKQSFEVQNKIKVLMNDLITFTDPERVRDPRERIYFDSTRPRPFYRISRY